MKRPGGCKCRKFIVHVGVSILSHLKEKLAWAADKWLWVISTIMLLKNSCSTKELKGTKAILNLKQYCFHCFVALSNVFSDSFYCGLSTVAFLVSQTRLI